MKNTKYIIAMLFCMGMVSLIIGCNDIVSENNPDTTAPTIISEHAGSKKFAVVFSEVIKFGSAGNTDGAGFTIKISTDDVPTEVSTNIKSAAILGRVLTLTLNTEITNPETSYARIEFADNAISDTADNVLAKKTEVSKLPIDTTAPTMRTDDVTTIVSTQSTFIWFDEKITYGSAIEKAYLLYTVLETLAPPNITVKTGASKEDLNTLENIQLANIYMDEPTKSTNVRKRLYLKFEPILTVGDYVQITFGANTITDLVGNALATDTQTVIFQVQAAP